MVRLAVRAGHSVVNLDALTYAACLDNVAAVADSPTIAFVQADIRDRAALDRVFADPCPDAVMHLAAESHVDRSIDGPGTFIDTNIIGTYHAAGSGAQPTGRRRGRPEGFRFHHISTDEVFGSLGADRASSPKTRLMIRAAPIRPPRRPPTIWCGPGTRPMGCRWC